MSILDNLLKVNKRNAAVQTMCKFLINDLFDYDLSASGRFFVRLGSSSKEKRLLKKGTKLDTEHFFTFSNFCELCFVK